MNAALKKPAAASPEWVFGYGSLMWDPGFAVAESRPALLRGWHRDFCIYSHHYRGTPQTPGLVLGLDAGGACRGVAHRFAATDKASVRAYLWEREIQNDGVYHEIVRPLRLDDGRAVEALVYVADRKHPQYAGDLSDEELARLIRQGKGARGTCLQYTASTIAHLDELGLKETRLHRLLTMARRDAR
jgi:cation transport protein ChaC